MASVSFNDLLAAVPSQRVSHKRGTILPAGSYRVMVCGAQWSVSKNTQNPQIVVTCIVAEGAYDGFGVKWYITFTDKTAAKTVKALMTLSCTREFLASEPSEDAMLVQILRHAPMLDITVKELSPSFSCVETAVRSCSNSPF